MTWSGRSGGWPRARWAKCVRAVLPPAKKKSPDQELEKKIETERQRDRETQRERESAEQMSPSRCHRAEQSRAKQSRAEEIFFFVSCFQSKMLRKRKRKRKIRGGERQTSRDGPARTVQRRFRSPSRPLAP